MVNTRRSETVSEARRHRHHRSTRGKGGTSESSGDCRSSDDQQVSQGDESGSWTPEWTNRSRAVLSNRVRELRNKYKSKKHDYTTSRVRKSHLKVRTSKRNEMEETRSSRRVVYADRMVEDDESDDMMDEIDRTEFNIYSSGRRPRRSIKVRSQEITYTDKRDRPQRRTAGKLELRSSREGLRPLKRESYADPNSPFSQDVENTSDDKPDHENTEIRRSKRQRKFRYNTFNTSWITEHQMIRGYPRDFNSDHEEDSKDSKESRDQNNEESNEKVQEDEEDNVSSNDMPLRPRRSATNGDSGRKKYVYKFLSRTTPSQPVCQRIPATENGIVTRRSLIENKELKTENNDRIIVNGEATQESVATNRNEEQEEGNEARSKPNKRNDDEHNESLIRESRLRQRTAISYNPGRSQNNERGDKRVVRGSREQHDMPRRQLRRRQSRPNLRMDSSTDSTSSSSDDDVIRKTNKKHLAGYTSMQKKPSNRRNTTPPRDKLKGKPKDLTLDPQTIDTSITFNSVGGLDEQVRCLREMVVLPMLYPEIFKMYHTNPPKGVLFHGPPGTGKTLMARALANECSVGNKKVAFFMRKGADLLSKWIGQTEKQMTMLFEQASQMAPSIIFFDEIDGLAPARTARQEQVHISVVVSLLALMDGLDKSRGEVIVIGATNRLDSLDPALRRPGRFDREIYFPLPSFNQRKEILNIIVNDWPEKPSNNMVTSLAERSVGYCGADLRALCTEAVLRSVRRIYPQIYESSHRLLIDPKRIKVESRDFDSAALTLVPAGSRGTPLHLGSSPPSYLEPLLSQPLQAAIELINRSFPLSIKSTSSSGLCGVASKENTCARLLIAGGGSHLVANALLKEFEHLSILTLDAVTLHNGLTASPEEACIRILNEARRNAPSILYLPRLNMWWDVANDSVKVLLNMMYSLFLTNVSTQITSILLLATIDNYKADFSNQITDLFSEYRHEVLEIEVPAAHEREAFFKPLIINESIDLPVVEPLSPTKIVHEALPRAPTPPPEPLSPHAKQVLFDKEEETLTELRIFLRDICKKLATNKAFFMFTKPVDLEEVPDYLDVVEKPMDLETMMTKVDLHCYASAQEFLCDIDLIQLNALTYNPDVNPADKQIRHRACWFRDYAYALIKAEMDTDFEENCRKISKHRKTRQSGDPHEFLPQHIRALAEEASAENESMQKLDTSQNANGPMEERALDPSSNANKTVNNSESVKKLPVRTSPHRKRRVPAWAKGFLTHGNKKKRKIADIPEEKSPLADKSVKKDLIDDLNSETESKENRPEDLPLKAEEIDNPDTSKTPSPSPTNKVDRRQSLQISKSELIKVLARVVLVTDSCSVDTLCDLYAQLKLRVKKYSHSYNRQNLPSEFDEELDRFQKHYY